ncbi:MAG: hypothetical protein N2557_06230 [Hydrogenophilus sp.]|nr:hypothetical protein [Hydrogenophilus sp.]
MKGKQCRWAIVGAALWSGVAAGHGLHYEVSRAEAVVIRLSYSDGTPFAYEGFEIRPEEGGTPVLVGRSDREGRVAFLPPRAGKWRLRAWSEDGHGVDVVFSTTEREGVKENNGGRWDRLGQAAIGVGVLLGVFGVVQLFLRRSR